MQVGAKSDEASSGIGSQLAITGQSTHSGLLECLGDCVPIDFCGSVMSLRIFDDHVTVKQVVLSGVWKDHRDRGHPPNGCQCAKRI